MFVARVVETLKTAPVFQREKIAHAFTHCFLQSSFNEEERPLAEDILLRLTDDPSPNVRRALAEGICHYAHAPRHVVHLLAHDVFSVAEPVLAFSAVISEADLINLVKTGGDDVQRIIAGRPFVSCRVAQAVADNGDGESCNTLLLNAGAELYAASVTRIADRHGSNALVRATLLDRPDLPIFLRRQLLSALGETLCGFSVTRFGLDAARMASIVADAKEKATVALIEMEDRKEIRALLERLVQNDELTPQLVLRALCCGNAVALEQALSLLTGQPEQRVFAIMTRGSGKAFSALYREAGFPVSLEPAFNSALMVFLDLCQESACEDPYRFRRAMVERVLTQYESATDVEVDPLISLLTRFAADAARDEARKNRVLIADAA